MITLEIIVFLFSNSLIDVRNLFQGNMMGYIPKKF